MGGYTPTPYYLDDLERLKNDMGLWGTALSSVPGITSPLDAALQAGGAAPAKIDPSGASGSWEPYDSNAPRKLTSDIVTPRDPQFADVNSKGDGSHVWVTMDGKTYDYSSGGLGVTGHMPSLSGPTDTGGPGLGATGNELGGGYTSMPPSRISPGDLAAEQASGATGVSMMPGTDDQQYELAMEDLAKRTNIAGGQAGLFKQQLLGPAIPGQQRPRSWADVKQEESRARLTGVARQVMSQFDPNTAIGQAGHAALMKQVTEDLAAGDPKAWAALPVEAKTARINQEMDTIINNMINTKFNETAAIESLSLGMASPLANMLRPRPPGGMEPTYWGQGYGQGYGSYP